MQTQIQGQPVTVQELGTRVEKTWSFPTHLAIGPKGQIVIRHLTPSNTKDIGDVAIKTMSGRAVLDPLYAARGWVMYEDLCAGRVNGVEADANAWKRWQSLIEHNARGKALPKALRNDDKLYHPEVARRRKAGGLEVVPSIDEYKAMFPGYDFDGETDEDDERARKSKGKGKG